MKYYSLTSTEDLDIIGEYPQVSTTNDSLFGSPFSTIKVNYGDIPDEIPFLELEFEENAKITDLLGTYNPYFGLIIDEKLKDIFSNTNLPNHRFYPVNVFFKNIPLPYYWFNFYDNIFPYLDMENSKFSVEENRQKLEYKFKSENFFKEKNIECIEDFNKTLRIEKIYLLDSFPKYDLFEFENFVLISEKLLNTFKENNITGYEAKRYEILQFDNV
ncbi:MAG: hypothetical protein ABI793_12065 [Flavobacterium sp.]